jgi:hypothetical protein
VNNTIIGEPWRYSVTARIIAQIVKDRRRAIGISVTPHGGDPYNQLDFNNRQICGVPRQVLERIRCQDQKTAMLINRRLGKSAVSDQENGMPLFEFAKRRPDRRSCCS